MFDFAKGIIPNGSLHPSWSKSRKVLRRESSQPLERSRSFPVGWPCSRNCLAILRHLPLTSVPEWLSGVSRERVSFRQRTHWVWYFISCPLLVCAGLHLISDSAQQVFSGADVARLLGGSPLTHVPAPLPVEKQESSRWSFGRLRSAKRPLPLVVSMVLIVDHSSDL